MRQDENAELLVYCPKCGLWANEYNWTLETASKYSVNGKQTHTLIYIFIDIAQGNYQKWENYKVLCPRCHESMQMRKLLPLPQEDLIAAYIAKVGQAYVQSLY
ncbi:MAG: hypothetical protein GX808_03435 [Syntrophomonadaceae bacterium]|jgi:DNA-directed RNA polymerase subunit M/transcription elongation factor TFIIS|nr:hypothetical protein [Syntrophomonadaceae bacterium]